MTLHPADDTNYVVRPFQLKRGSMPSVRGGALHTIPGDEK